MTDYTNPPAYTLYTGSTPVQGTQTHDQTAGQNLSSNGIAGMNPPLMGIQAGQPIQVFVYPQPPTVYGGYQSTKSRNLGITQIILGALSIVFNAVGISYLAELSYAGVGIWGGILFIINGAFGISAAKLRTKCKITTVLVLSIISSVTTIALIICAVMGAALQYPYYGYYGYSCNGGRYEYGDYHYHQNTCRAVAVAMNSVLAVLAVAEAVAAIWSSVLCCKVYGCCDSSGNMMTSPQYAPVQGSQQVIIVPRSQLNSGGPLTTYATGYPPQQVIGGAAPSYPTNHGLDSTPQLVPAQSNLGINNNMEKQLL